jgi:aminoglycoside phosphotransferase (APT) family kinase protein
MIPDAKLPAVMRAIQEAFGADTFDDIHPLTGGLSTALVFRIVVRGAPCLLRIIMPGALGDPTREFACMQAAAEAGVAPRIWHANATDKILITDFVEAKPFPDDMPARIAPVLRRLHALPRFREPMVVKSYFDAVDGFVRRFEAAKILPESRTAELLESYAKMAKVYPRNGADLVASHNDLKPQNTLFDGERVWLVDWEAAFLNDRYLDLAVAANFFVKDETSVEDYLQAYFGEPAGDHRSARFYLMRQICHVAYATLFLLIASSKRLAVDPEMEVPEFRDFHRRVVSGEVDLATADAKLQYAMVHLNRALENMRTPRFEQAMAMVARNLTSA